MAISATTVLKPNPLVLRAREPDLPRPFKVWGYPGTTLGVLLASAELSDCAYDQRDIKHTLFTLVFIVLSYPVYLFAVKKRNSVAAPISSDQHPS